MTANDEKEKEEQEEKWIAAFSDKATNGDETSNKELEQWKEAFKQ